MNGYPNLFEGWGGEDDAMYNRIIQNGLDIVRFDPWVARYRMMPHKMEVPSPSRFDLLEKSNSDDGLSSLQ